MQCKIYTTSSEPTAFDKVLTQIGETKTIQPFEPLTDITGRILLSYNSAYENANYCEINGKYYFVEDRSLEIGGRMYFYLRNDVLANYKEYIKTCPAVIARNETLANSYLLDNSMKTLQPKMQQVKIIGSFSYSYFYTLVTVG